MKSITFMALVSMTLCRAAVAQYVSFEHLYWATAAGAIQRAKPDGSDPIELLATGDRINDFVVDRRAGRVYRTNNFDIFGAGLDGSNEQPVFSPGFFLSDVELDPVENVLFYANIRDNVIGRVRTDGAEASIILPAHGTPSNADGVRELSIDVSGRKLYWIERFTTTSFWRSDLDGDSREQLFSIAENVTQILVDSATEKLFWATSALRDQGKIWRSNLDGSDSHVLVDSNLWGVSGLAYDSSHNRLYFSDTWLSGPTDYDTTLKVLDITSGQATTLLNFGPSTLGTVAYVSFGFAVPEPTPHSVPAVFGALLLVRFGTLRPYPVGRSAPSFGQTSSQRTEGCWPKAIVAVA